ncbi:MAG: DUF3047 domain-containing protein, partial [Nitrospirota bacterium]|nr:DUF3047 domain-containing protein [Nitrospirota bacterium]
SGKDKLNTWITEERNLFDDYRKAFGEAPPMVSGVAIMTDADNTKETGTAYYGDIVFKKAIDPYRASRGRDRRPLQMLLPNPLPLAPGLVPPSGPVLRLPQGFHSHRLPSA